MTIDNDAGWLLLVITTGLNHYAMARTTRKNVMYPHTRIIPLDTASYTIQSLIEILQWIVSNP